jgi:hypothetical protein
MSSAGSKALSPSFAPAPVFAPESRTVPATALSSLSSHVVAVAGSAPDASSAKEARLEAEVARLTAEVEAISDPEMAKSVARLEASSAKEARLEAEVARLNAEIWAISDPEMAKSVARLEAEVEALRSRAPDASGATEPAAAELVSAAADLRTGVHPLPSGWDMGLARNGEPCFVNTGAHWMRLRRAWLS